MPARLPASGAHQSAASHPTAQHKVTSAPPSMLLKCSTPTPAQQQEAVGPRPQLHTRNIRRLAGP